MAVRRLIRAGRRVTALIALTASVAAAVVAAAPSTARADFESARAAIRAGDVDEGLPEIRRLAGSGHAGAQGVLAEMHLRGIGVERDVPAAMEWLCRAAHDPVGGRVVAQAMWYLAEYFRTGGGLPGPTYNDGRREDEDPIRAYFWFTVMANQSRHFETPDENGEKLGRLGAREVGRALYERERTAVREAAERWRPATAFGSTPPCLALPDGL